MPIQKHKRAKFILKLEAWNPSVANKKNEKMNNMK